MSQPDRAIYVYAVCAGGRQLQIRATGVGPGDAPVRRLERDGVAALVSDVPVGPLAAPDLRAHWRVLAEAAAQATVLPVRFGTVMETEDAVRDEFLAPSAERLRRLLAELDGKVQLSVKGFYDEESLLRAAVERSPAVARLRDRTRRLPEAATYYDRIRLGELVAAELERSRARDAELVIDRLRPLAVAATAEPSTGADGPLNTAFLVERTRVDTFTQGVQELSAELGDRMQIRCVGPLPPYSFADEEAAAAWA